MDLSLNIGSAEQDRKRKTKDERRRKAKEERKNKLKEQSHQKALAPSQKHLKQVEKKNTESNKEQLDMELLKAMNVAEKLTFIRSTANELIIDPEDKYRKLKDLLLCCSDPKDIDVVIKALKALCDVFCDILPGYRIREQKTNVSEDAAGGSEKKDEGKSQKVSKEVQNMREHEQFILSSYKEYLKILEVFSRTKPEKLIKQKNITDEDKRIKALEIYRKLRELSFISFCRLLKTHPHFNYRLNVLQLIMPRLSTKDLVIREQCTQTVFELLSSEDNTMLDFKVEILRELSKTIKSRDHSQMSPALLDCLVSHKIIVDEAKAKMID
jgi:nucleolar complex protein 3